MNIRFLRCNGGDVSNRASGRLSIGWLPALLVLPFLLTGCATVSKSDCLSADAASWAKLGYNDGARGHLQGERIELHERACGRYSVKVDQAAYQRGFAQGIADFCIPERGYQQGAEGHRYAYNCPAELEQAYLKSYRVGLHHALTYLRFYEWDLDSGLWSAEREYRRDVAQSDDASAGEQSNQNQVARSLERVNRLESRIQNVRQREREIMSQIARADRRLRKIAGIPESG